MPVLDHIAAENPMAVPDHPEAHIPVDPGFYRHEQCFALKVSGDSMIRVHILIKSVPEKNHMPENDITTVLACHNPLIRLVLHFKKNAAN
jgi:SOS-response transcriptional repressor LexA